MIFGYTLTCLRHQKGMRQKTVAYGLGIDPSHLSRIENGRKAPHQFEGFIDKLGPLLELSDGEMSLLRSCAKAERQLGEFTVGASIDQIKLALAFANQLKSLAPEQITAIKAILDLRLDEDAIARQEEICS